MKKKSDRDNLESLLKKACEGLIYISETDADVLPLIGKDIQKNSVDEYLNTDDEKIRPIPVDQFFDRVTATKDWHGKSERDQAEKWTRLRNLLEANLSQLKVLKVGDIRIDIYIVGASKSGKIAGVKTKAVET